MLLVRKRRPASISRRVFLTILLKFTIVNKCASTQEICTDSNRRNISYFKPDIDEVDWNQASRECISRNSVLPVICNNNEQDAFVNYLNTAIGSSAAWTSGKKINFINWTWIDGQPFFGIISSPHESCTHAILYKRRGYAELSPQNRTHYLCQNSGSSCNSEDVINVTNGCIRPSNDYRTWFDARNQCLKKGSDLAILADADLNTLKISDKLTAGYSYWIGLRKNAWCWMGQRTDDSSEDIEYSNWSPVWSSSTEECISINASNGEWKAVGCTETMKVICERGAKTTSTMSERATRNWIDSSTINPRVVFYLGVGAGIVLDIIIGIIVVILAVKYARMFCNRGSPDARSGETTENERYQDLETTRKQTKLDVTYTELRYQPVYENVCQLGN